MQPASIVVVGGGVAGVSTVTALREHGWTGELSLIDSGDFPYDRPPLSKGYLSGAKSAEQLALQPPQFYDDQRIRLITGTEVSRLLPDEGAVQLADGRALPAERVVLAVGATPLLPPIPGATGPRVSVLRTRADADRLRAALRPGARLLIVGAGLIGAEVAATAAQAGCWTLLVDPAPIPGEAAFGPELASWLHEQHGHHGVQTRQAAVESFTEVPDGLQVRVSGQPEPVLVDHALIGVGVVPDTGLAAQAGLDVDGGILVDAEQVSCNPAVLAVGDSARHRRRDGGLGPRVEHWDAAQQGGRRAAATLFELPPPAAAPPWFWSDRHGAHVEVVGEMAAASHRCVRGQFGTAPFTVFGLRDGKLVAAAAVDDALAVRAASRLIGRGSAVDAGALTDPATSLRALARG